MVDLVFLAEALTLHRPECVSCWKLPSVPVKKQFPAGHHPPVKEETFLTFPSHHILSRVTDHPIPSYPELSHRQTVQHLSHPVPSPVLVTTLPFIKSIVNDVSYHIRFWELIHLDVARSRSGTSTESCGAKRRRQALSMAQPVGAA